MLVGIIKTGSECEVVVLGIPGKRANPVKLGSSSRDEVEQLIIENKLFSRIEMRTTLADLDHEGIIWRMADDAEIARHANKVGEA